MFIENNSRFDFDTTVEKIRELVANGGWSLLHVHDIKGIIGNKGYDVLPVTVMEVCKAPLSAKILGSDDDRAISVMMPCRISVYQKGNGDVVIGRMDAASMATGMEGAGAEVMLEAFRQMEEILKPVLV
jgi:uncharacterized protein (DUF302 family)